MAIAQSRKAGVWMRDCEGLLHPDMGKVSLSHKALQNSFSLWFSFCGHESQMFSSANKITKSCFCFFSVAKLLIISNNSQVLRGEVMLSRDQRGEEAKNSQIFRNANHMG